MTTSRRDLPSAAEVLATGWEYARQVVDGEIAVCSEQKLVIGRLYDLWCAGGDDRWCFMDAAAERILAFCMKRMRLKDGKWDQKPFVPLPWQALYLACLFGWVDRETGTRRYSESFICTGKASGKNILLATIGYYMLSADGEGSPEVVVAAATKQQARHVFDSITWSMEIARPDLLESRYVVLGGSTPYEIVDHQANGTLRRVSADTKARGASGGNFNALIIDELHEHPGPELKEMLEAGVGKAREQAIFVIATNAGPNRVDHAWQTYEYARNVAQLDSDPFYLPWLYNIDADDDPETDRECWIKANPSWPTTPTYLEKRVAKMSSSSAARRRILRLNFGVWDTGGKAPWLTLREWDAMLVEKRPDWVAGVRGCFLGVDLSLRRDLTSAATVWVRPDTSPVQLHAEVTNWITAERAREGEGDRGIPFETWAERGDVVIESAGTISLDQIVAHIMEVDRAFGITRMAVDPRRLKELIQTADDNGVTMSAEATEADRPGGVHLALHAQGYFPTSDADLAMERSISNVEDIGLEGRLTILRNAPLRMAQQTALLVMDGKANRMFKKMADQFPIDPLVALVMGVGAAVAARAAAKPRGLAPLLEMYEGLYGTGDESDEAAA